MNKNLSKAFMHRSKLKNKFNKNPSEINKDLYRKQRNYCVNLVKKKKKKYYNNLDVNILKDNQKCWLTINPLFSTKQSDTRRNIVILENGIVTSDKNEVAEKLKNYFTVRNLDIESFVPDNNLEDININPDDILDNIGKIITKYKCHPSILKIKENVIIGNKFEFKDMTPEQTETEIKQLNPKKTCIENDIPTKILVGSNDIVSQYLSDIYNTSKNSQKYPLSLQVADVTLVHKAFAFAEEL